MKAPTGCKNRWQDFVKIVLRSGLP